MKRFALLMICGVLAGCAATPPEKIAVDLAPRRCPAIPSADLAALAQSPRPAPAGDVTKAAAQEWIDGLGAQVRQMNRAGARLVALYRACRNGKGSLKVAS